MRLICISHRGTEAEIICIVVHSTEFTCLGMEIAELRQEVLFNGITGGQEIFLSSFIFNAG